MDKLKNKNQTSYIKERIIGENVRLVVEIIHFCKENNEEGILTFMIWLKGNFCLKHLNIKLRK